MPNARWGIAPNNFDSFEAKIYAAEAEVIENCAKGGACVIVGRCADYVLRGKAKCLNVFVYADDSARIKRVMEVYGDAPNEKKAQKLTSELQSPYVISYAVFCLKKKNTHNHGTIKQHDANTVSL